MEGNVDIWEAAEKTERDLAGLMAVVGHALDKLVPIYHGQVTRTLTAQAVDKLKAEYNKLKLQQKETK